MSCNAVSYSPTSCNMVFVTLASTITTKLALQHCHNHQPSRRNVVVITNRHIAGQCDRHPSDFCQTFVGHPLDFYQTFIGRLSIFCQISIRHPFEFHLTTILFRLTIIPFCSTTVQFHLMVISFHPTTILFRSMAVPIKDVHSLFIPINALYSLNRTLCYNFVGSVLYYYKI